MNDHDRIVKLCTNMDWMIIQITNHLKHHWVVTLAAVGAAFSAIGVVIVVLIAK